jgi:Zinc-finger double-stranded RNA-binding
VNQSKNKRRNITSVLRKQSARARAPASSSSSSSSGRAILDDLDKQFSASATSTSSGMATATDAMPSALSSSAVEGLYCPTCSLYYPTQQLLDTHFASKRHKKTYVNVCVARSVCLSLLCFPFIELV